MREFFTLFLVMPLVGAGQAKDIKIHVALKGVPDGQKFYLFRAVNWDSAIAKDGQFDLTYHKFSSEPEATAITTGDKEPGILCWVENQNITITATYPDFMVTASTGSVTQKEFDVLAVTIKPDQVALKKLRREMFSEKDPVKKELARTKLDSANLIYKKKITDFIYANPGSSVSTFMLWISTSYTFTGSEIRELYARLDKSQQESEMGKSRIKTLEMLEQLESQMKNSKPKN